MRIRNKIKDKKSVKKSVKDTGKKDRFLILHNDDTNAYEHVIDALVEVCEHDVVQAEQCTFIAHHKGKCDIRKGTYRSLRLLKLKLANKGLTATIQ